jgi:hypothetical protein
MTIIWNAEAAAVHLKHTVAPDGTIVPPTKDLAHTAPVGGYCTGLPAKSWGGKGPPSKGATFGEKFSLSEQKGGNEHHRLFVGPPRAFSPDTLFSQTLLNASSPMCSLV